ncbi:MAG: GNAT family N-acetyltransferase [Chitinophagaceae bacterium]|nr:GNAT family N-acetyltransferase [Chitinophagaceae bacterium]
MNIRQVKEADNPALAALIRSVFEEYGAPKQGTVYSDPTTDHLYQLFQKDKAVLWVAEAEGNVAGCCGIYPTEGLAERYAELVKFYISPHARGKGTGKQLMAKSIESAKNFGYTTLYIESMAAFSNAVMMYEKYGFTHIPRPLGNSGHSSCTIWMVKTL